MERIPLKQTTEYHIGAVTYEVAAFFYEDGQNLRDKLQHLIVQEVRNHANRTFADRRDNVVK